MTQISLLLEQSLDALQNITAQLICALARQWPNELMRLCQPMNNSPSILHTLNNISDSELPSAILLANGLLLNAEGQIQTAEHYDRTTYIELNRGMSSAIALFYVLRGDCYLQFIEGQKPEQVVSKNRYVQLHDEYNNLFKKNGLWNSELLDTIFYAVLFNDLGKNYELKNIINNKQIGEEHDHDLILQRAMQTDGLLIDFSRLNSAQQNCLRALWHGGFNPSSFDTLEYPLSTVIHWIISFSNKAKEEAMTYLAMKKIEILFDIAGVNGNRSKGATNLTEAVIAKFDYSFSLLGQLVTTYQHHQSAGMTDTRFIYSVLHQQLQLHLLAYAKSLGLIQENAFTPRSILMLRLCKMLGIKTEQQTHSIQAVLTQLEQNNPANYHVLEHEFAWEATPDKPILWLEHVPKFLWLMSNGNNVDLIDGNSPLNSSLRKENGLYAALLIVCKALEDIRKNQHYDALYEFKNHELIHASNTLSTLDNPKIALFTAQDLVQCAQRSSAVNPDLNSKTKANITLNELWKQGPQLKGNQITCNKAPTAIEQTASVGIRHTLFHSSTSQAKCSNFSQGLLNSLIEQTKEHCNYLSAIGWADRAACFKVSPFIYAAMPQKQIDISRFNERTPLPELVRTFDIHAPNTLFTHADSPEQSQEQEIQRSLDVRLYPPLKRLISEHGVSIFLGSKVELQAYAESVHDKLIIQLDIPSSATFYVALNASGRIKIYLSGLVSYENMIQQLITLKLADIELNSIPIIGNPQQYSLICKNDLLKFKEQAKDYLARKNVLIVAGCDLEQMACSSLEQILEGNTTKKTFSGDLVSLSYMQSKHAPDLGFIVLNLNYGEICEEQVSTILNQFNCIAVFSGSAAGYIPKAQSKSPEIGERLSVHTSRHYSGEIITLNPEHQAVHLHVPTIFVETATWLDKAKQLGATTVDVETFYILKALKKYQSEHPNANIITDIGVFISDYVGEKPLRHYKNVFSQYPLILADFVQRVLVASLTSSYSNNRSSIPTFSNQYISLIPEQTEIKPSLKKEAVVDSIGSKWDKTEFSKRVHTPVTIGSVRDKNRFTTAHAPRCLHLPIKLPGSDIRIPNEYQHFFDELQQIFNFEASINPGWNDLYAYLTVDQGFIPRSNFQRVPGPHVDGIPRDREHPEAQLIDHAYLVTNAIPTMFYTQQFDMNAYDPNLHHFFAIFRALSDESRTITVEPFAISLMNAYSVHTPTQTLEDVDRTFIRLEFSTLKFDRSGNSINRHFCQNEFPDYPFNYVPRPIPTHLVVPSSVYDEKPITNANYIHETLDNFGRIKLKAVFLQNPRYIEKRSSYKNLDLIAAEIMNPETQGIVASQSGIPHALFLYKIENKKVKLDTLFTLTVGAGQELMISGMYALQKIADRLSLQAGLEEGATPITIVVNENNTEMLKYFLRAARLAKIAVDIERPLAPALIENTPLVERATASL